jgi:DNA-binding response OmpR family regulator
MKILIIEDEPQLVNSIKQYLKKEHYVCETATSEQEACDKILIYDYDCILLDIALPDGNGLRILEVIKHAGKSDGVIIISAKNSLDDRIIGLNLGADDYLAKPFFLPELSARISAVIRRKNFGGKNNITFREISIDVPGKAVEVNATKVELTRREFDLLCFLVANKGRVISKHAISEHLSGDDAELFDNFDFIYSHIKNLKRKLQDAGAEDYIKTVYGLGYKFAE